MSIFLRKKWCSGWEAVGQLSSFDALLPSSLLLLRTQTDLGHPKRDIVFTEMVLANLEYVMCVCYVNIWCITAFNVVFGKKAYFKQFKASFMFFNTSVLPIWLKESKDFIIFDRENMGV